MEDIRPEYATATELFQLDSPSSVQLYQVHINKALLCLCIVLADCLTLFLCFQAVPPGLNSGDVVGQPIMHLSALKQATGEAVYCDDIPCYENELHLALVTSTKAHALIKLVEKGHVMFWNYLILG